MKTLVLSLLVLLVIGCQPEPKAIEYGHEACEYCRMTIVDDRYAAQLVSQKNKAYSFDAMECMIHFKNENQGQTWAWELVTDYNRPKNMIAAENAVIVRSKQLPSPMGMYFTAVSNQEEAQKLQEQHGGKIYSYPEVASEPENLPAL